MSRKIKLKNRFSSVSVSLNWQQIWLKEVLPINWTGNESGCQECYLYKLSILKEILPVYELVTSLANRNILPWNCLNWFFFTSNLNSPQDWLSGMLPWNYQHWKECYHTCNLNSPKDCLSAMLPWNYQHWKKCYHTCNLKSPQDWLTGISPWNCQHWKNCYL